MKVVSTQLHPRYLGWLLAAGNILGHKNVIYWEPDRKPIFDMLDEIKPDMLCCDIRYVNRTFIRACNEYTGVKTVLFSPGIPQNFHPSVVIAPPSTSTVIRKHLEGPDHKTLYLKDSADVCSFWGGEVDERLACDIGYLSQDNDPEKLQAKVQILASMVNLGTVRIVGGARMPLPQYIGLIKPNRVASFLKSCKMILDYQGDIILDAAANGAFVVSTTRNGLYPDLESTDLKTLLTDVKSAARAKIAKKAQSNVLSADTCYHRFVEVMNALGATECAELALDKIQELKTQCGLA